jgi:CheY-like chemotaxis protein
VTVRVFCDHSSGVIEVSDNGRGIEPSLLPHLFERFRQGERQPSDRQSGLGLGLSITRHLVEMHGGSVEAATEGEGKGATFTIRLPLHVAEESDPMIRRDSAGRAIALPRLDGVSVLLVEDDVDNRNVLAAALKHCGATVECATSAARAFEIVSQWKPDVIVSDIALPDMDGCDFLSRIRAGEDGATSEAPALALTVLGRPGEQERILAAGFEMFRQKPIDPIDFAYETARLAGRG